MKNREELELRTLKHLVTSEKALTKATSLNIRADHFMFVKELSTINYHSQIFKLINKYFDESGGSLLTKNVLENRLKRSGVEETPTMEFLKVWEKIQEQDYEENDLYDLLIELKQHLALQYYNEMYKQGHETMTNEGIEASVDTIQEKLDQIRDEIYLIENERENIEITDSSEYFEKEYTKRRDDFEKYKGIYSGLKHIDNRTFGFMPGQIITLLASTSGGKSVQLLNWATYAHMFQKKNVLYFSFEMDAWLCILRHFSLIFEVPYDSLKSITCDNEEIKSIMAKIKSLKGGPYFEYEVSMEDPTPEFVDNKIKELSSTKGKPDIVIVDYIGNMTTRNTRPDAKPWEKQGDALAKLFVLAKRYNIPFVTAQQINRESIRENRKLKESGKTAAFYQDAASGDQRLMHYSYYVIGLEPDKENKMFTYYPVKMRDAYFEPFSTRIDPVTNRIYELTEEEQEEYKKTKLNALSGGQNRKAPIASTFGDGATKIDSEYNTNIYSPDDLQIGAIDEEDWHVDMPEEN